MKNSEYSNDNYIWNVKSPEMFERFAAQLQEYTRTNTLPVCADQDVQYVLELQQRRLSGKNLQMFYQISPRGHFGEKTPFRRTWSDNRYVSEMTARSFELTRTIFKDKKQIYHKVQKKNLYQTITDVKGHVFMPNESYICPNCGAICQVDEQNRYCSYCGTYFEMPDLFPKVTNYFFLEDVGGTEREIKQEIARFVKPCILLACILYTIFFAFQGDKSIMGTLCAGVLAGVIGGGVSGYLIWVFWKLCTMFVGAGKSIGFLVNAAGSENRFLRTMRAYSAEFSYEYFSNKIVSLLKMILFAKNIQELPNYFGNAVAARLADIVEASFYGVALKQCMIRDRYVYVTVEVYMEVLYYDEERIREKEEKFKMQLYRRIDKPIDYHFTIRKIQCKHCGASFDATKQRRCPHCNQAYDLADDDWIVTGVV